MGVFSFSRWQCHRVVEVGTKLRLVRRGKGEGDGLKCRWLAPTPLQSRVSDSQEVRNGVHECVCLVRPQEMLMLLVWGLHFENHSLPYTPRNRFLGCKVMYLLKFYEGLPAYQPTLLSAVGKSASC